MKFDTTKQNVRTSFIILIVAIATVYHLLLIPGRFGKPTPLILTKACGQSVNLTLSTSKLIHMKHESVIRLSQTYCLTTL